MTKLTVRPPTIRDIYCHYPSQTDAQGVYLYLNAETGSARITYDGEIGGGLPMDVHHGITRRYRLPIIPSVDYAQWLLNRLAPQLQRVIDGSEAVWDGSNNVGREDDDALDAETIIQATLDASTHEDAYYETDASEWFAAERGAIVDEVREHGVSDTFIAHEGRGTEEEPVLHDLFEYLTGIQEAIDSRLSPYSIALAMESGAWDTVERFTAATDGAANAYAEAEYDHLEWYVLDGNGSNINA
jgi:hypothetical protein